MAKFRSSILIALCSVALAIQAPLVHAHVLLSPHIGHSGSGPQFVWHNFLRHDLHRHEVHSHKHHLHDHHSHSHNHVHQPHKKAKYESTGHEQHDHEPCHSTSDHDFDLISHKSQCKPIYWPVFWQVLIPEPSRTWTPREQSSVLVWEPWISTGYTTRAPPAVESSTV